MIVTAQTVVVMEVYCSVCDKYITVIVEDVGQQLSLSAYR